MVIRLAKVLTVLLIGLFAVLVGYDNLVDYDSNYEFVRHVLSMDTTFPGNKLLSRAITDPALHTAAYWAIIAAELLTGILCLVGAALLAAKVRAPARAFNAAKGTAIAGLTTGFALWFFGFLTVGGEWFAMWQSQTWNGQEAAFRFIVSIGIVLLFVTIEDHD